MLRQCGSMGLGVEATSDKGVGSETTEEVYVYVYVYVYVLTHTEKTQYRPAQNLLRSYSDLAQY